jgi:coenzyme F420-reducing hydrogenase beta subunit
MNDKVCKNSSSGGIATALSTQIIDDGGFFCGCCFKNGKTSHLMTNKIEELSSFQGSKYVKSELGNVFLEIKKLIKLSKVLFIGTPCQVYGLKRFLFSDKNISNLYTVDLVCHGTPQQIVLQKYLNELNVPMKILNIRFRSKTAFSIVINNNDRFSKVCDPYTMGFLNGLTYTENCYSCKFANLDRVGDITLGDAWGEPQSEMAKGLSLILINSEKGKNLFNSIEKKITYKTTALSSIINNNGQLSHPSIKPRKREYFFSNFNRLSFKKLISRIYPKMVMKQRIKKLLLMSNILKK